MIFKVTASVINGNPVAEIEVAKATTIMVNLSGLALKIPKALVIGYLNNP